MVSKYFTVAVSLLFLYLVAAHPTKCFAGSIEDMSFGEPNAPVSIIGGFVVHCRVPHKYLSRD